MREILFRGKLTGTGKWVVGCLDHNPVTKLSFIRIPRHIYTDVEMVCPETVGQYTGLTDKNGTKIFEGDIVDCWSEGVNAKGTVQQRKDGLWIIYPAWQEKIMWGLCPDEYCHTTVEVIGNIHDNPELTGGADNGE